MDSILRTIGGIELFVLTMGFWAFTLLFHVLSDWKESELGRHFMSLMMSCSLILAWSFAGYAFELSPTFRAWGRVILYGSLAFIVWRQVRILVKTQIIVRDADKKAKDEKEEVSNGAIA